MKKIIYLFLISIQFLFAQSDFEKGNDLYQKAKYEQAISVYEGILASKKQSAELYFNLGNCYYKLNKVAPAIYNYEKALVLNPSDTEIQNNLKFAQKLQIDEIKVVPKVGFSQWLLETVSVFGYNTWAWIAIVFAMLFLLCFVGYYFSLTTTNKRLSFIGMFVFLILILMSIFAGFFEKTNLDNEKPAIVFSESANVYSEPQKNSPTALVLHEGTKVFVLETLEHWKKIQLTDGTEGWIDKNAIREVK